MLLLKTRWKEGTKSVDIEYDTPLEQCRNRYYTLTLDSIYSTAAETKPVTVPITFSIYDSPYLAAISTDTMDPNRPISRYSEHIATLLNGNGTGVNERASKKLKQTLQNYHEEIPNARFSPVNDEDFASRYFNLNVPSSTHIFSNSKYPLYALGYSDDQIEFIQNTASHGISPILLQTLKSFGNYADCDSIYIAPKLGTNSQFPMDAQQGQIKWLNNDTFESVYFPGRRDSRRIADIVPGNRVRRETITPFLSDLEVQAEIKVGDKKNIKLAKLAKLKKWDSFGSSLIVQADTLGDYSALQNVSEGETPATAKHTYWRDQIVLAIVNTPLQTDANVVDVPVKVPIDYFAFDRMSEMEVPMKLLLEDPKPYVQLGAAGLYSSYLASLSTDLGAAIADNSDNAEIVNRLTEEKSTVDDKYGDIQETKTTLESDVAVKRAEEKRQIEKVKPLTPSQEQIRRNATIKENVIKTYEQLEKKEEAIKEKKTKINNKMAQFTTDARTATSQKDLAKQKYNEWVDKLRDADYDVQLSSKDLVEEVEGIESSIRSIETEVQQFRVKHNLAGMHVEGKAQFVNKVNELKSASENSQLEQSVLNIAKRKFEAAKKLLTNYNKFADNINTRATQIDRLLATIQNAEKFVTDMVSQMKLVDVLFTRRERYTIPEKLPERTGNEPPSKKPKLEYRDELNLENEELDTELINDIMNILSTKENNKDDQKSNANLGETQVDIHITNVKSTANEVIDLFNNFRGDLDAKSFKELEQQYGNKMDELQAKSNEEIQKINQIVETITNNLNENTSKRAKYYVDYLNFYQKSPTTAFNIAITITEDLPNANDHLNNITRAEQEIQQSKQNITNKVADTATKFHQFIQEVDIPFSSLMSLKNRGDPYVIPPAFTKYIEDIVNESVMDQSNEDGGGGGNVVQTDNGGGGVDGGGVTSGGIDDGVDDGDRDPGDTVPATNNEVEGGGDVETGPANVQTDNGDGGVDGGRDPGVTEPATNNEVEGGGDGDGDGDNNGDDVHEEEEVVEVEEEEDDRANPDFQRRYKYTIGFVHFRKTPQLWKVDRLFEVKDTTTAKTIRDYFISVLNRPLLRDKLLNLKFAPKFEMLPNTGGGRGIDTNFFAFSNTALLDSNQTKLIISLKSERFAKVMRMFNLTNAKHEFILNANETVDKLKSQHFDNTSPFVNDFKENLPIIPSPKNAGLFNTFASEIGETRALGIVETEGRVKNSVPITLRPRSKERFAIDFRGVDLTDKFPIRDYMLYLHFTVQTL